MDHNGEVVTESCHRRGGEGGGILLTRCLRQGLGGGYRPKSFFWSVSFVEMVQTGENFSVCISFCPTNTEPEHRTTRSCVTLFCSVAFVFRA